MRLLICGGRDFDDMWMMDRALAPYLSICTVVIHGAARGADRMGARWGAYYGKEVLAFPADWNTFQNSAGPIRNRQMITEGKPDLVVAFPGGPGTRDMIKVALAARIKVVRVGCLTTDNSLWNAQTAEGVQNPKR